MSVFAQNFFICAAGNTNIVLKARISTFLYVFRKEVSGGTSKKISDTLEAVRESVGEVKTLVSSVYFHLCVASYPGSRPPL